MYNEEDRKWLYEQMQQSGVDTGSYDEFKTSLNDKADREWYYNKSKELGLDVGTQQDFDQMMVEPAKPQMQAASVEQPTPSGQSPATPLNGFVQPKFDASQIQMPDERTDLEKTIDMVFGPQIAARKAADEQQAQQNDEFWRNDPAMQQRAEYNRRNGILLDPTVPRDQRGIQLGQQQPSLLDVSNPRYAAIIKNDEAVKSAMDSFNRALSEQKQQYEKHAQQSHGNPFAPTGTNMLNEARMQSQIMNPEKAIQSTIDQMTAQMLQDDYFTSDGQNLNDAGRYALQSMQQKMVEQLVAERMPQSSAEYIVGNAIRNSDFGKLARLASSTDFENYLDDLAAQMYQPGFWERVGTGALTFGLNMPEYLLTGTAGGALSKGMLNGITKMTTEGLVRKGVERSVAERAAQMLLGNTMRGKAAQVGAASVSGSTTFGLQPIIGTPIDLAYKTGQPLGENGEAFTPEISDYIGETWKEMKKGALMGTLMVGGAAAGATEKIAQGAVKEGLARGAAGFGYDAGVMAGFSLADMKEADPNFEITPETAAEAYAESAASLGLLKLPHMIGMRGQIEQAKQAQKFKFTPEEKQYLRNMGIEDPVDMALQMANRGAEQPSFLKSIMRGVESRKGNSEAGTDIIVDEAQPIDAENMQQLTAAYRSFMASEAPETIKAKAMYLIEGKMPARLSPVTGTRIIDIDGKVYFETLNEKGGVIEHKPMKDVESARTEQQKLAYDVDMNVTSAMENRLNELETATDFGNMLQEGYEAIRQKAVSDPDKLTAEEREMLSMAQNIPAIMQRANAGAELTPSEQALLNRAWSRLNSYKEEHSASRRIAAEIEAKYGLNEGEIEKAIYGHSKEEAEQVAGELSGTVEVGNGTYRTDLEQQIVDEYRQKMLQRINEHEEARKAEAEAQTQEGAGEQPVVNNADRLIEGSVEQPIDTEGAAGPDGKPSETVADGADGSSAEAGAAGERPAIDIEGARHRGKDAFYAQDQQGIREVGRRLKVADARMNRYFDPEQVKAIEEAVNSGNIDAIDRTGMNAMQQQAIDKFVETRAEAEGFNMAMQEQHDSQTALDEAAIEPYQSEAGEIIPLTLDNGQQAYYKSGDLNNKFGTVIVTYTDESGQPKEMQWPVSKIREQGNAMPTEQFAERLSSDLLDQSERRNMDWLLGNRVETGQQVELTIAGETIPFTVDGFFQNGDVKLSDSDGNPMWMTKQEVLERMEATEQLNVEAELQMEAAQYREGVRQQREADRQAEIQQRTERYNNGIVGMKEGTPDFTAADSDPKVVAEYLIGSSRKEEQTLAEVKPEVIKNIQTSKDEYKQQQIQLQQELAKLNSDIYTGEGILDGEELEQMKSRKAEVESLLQDLVARQVKWAEVRDELMTREEKQQFEQERRKQVFDARTGYKPAEQKRNFGQDAEHITLNEDGTPNYGLTPTGNVNNYLLKNFDSSIDAERFMNEQRIALRNMQRDQVQPQINAINDELNAYAGGRMELTPAEIKERVERVADLEAYQDMLSKEAAHLREIVDGIEDLYERNGSHEPSTPQEQRMAALSEAKSAQDKLRIAREVYKDDEHALSTINDTEPRDIHEYISQNLGRGTINWEGFDRGDHHVRGLQEELGSGWERGISKGKSTNAFNMYLAAEGEGKGIEEIVHGLYEAQPDGQDGTKPYSTEDLRNGLIDLLSTAQRPSDISHLTINNRIAEAEEYVSAMEEYEAIQAQIAAEDDAIRQSTGMEPDEYDAFIGDLEQRLAEQEGFENSEEYFKFAEEYERREQEGNAGGSQEASALGMQREESQQTPVETEAEQGAEKPDGGVADTAIQGLDGYTEKDVTDLVSQHFADVAGDSGVEIVGMKVIGSRTNGTAKDDSDLDVLLEYKGDMSEDGLFNILNDAENRLEIEGIPVDINPITEGKSGTIDQFLERNKDYKKEDEAAGETSVSELDSSFSARLAKAKAETNTNPTEAQKQAGNYKKPQLKFGGYTFRIENPKGSTRSGVDANGKPWSIEMKDTYGYIEEKTGKDGDKMDFFINDDADLDKFNGRVYVVDQKNEDGTFDEHKVMYGYPTWGAAKRAYERNYEPGWWDKHVMQMMGVKKDRFDQWLAESDHKLKPYADYFRMKYDDPVADPMQDVMASMRDRMQVSQPEASIEQEITPSFKEGELERRTIDELRQLRNKRQRDRSTSRVLLGTVNIQPGSDKEHTLKTNIEQATADIDAIDKAIDAKKAEIADRINQQEIGSAMVDQLERMGFDVTADKREMRRVRKQAEKDKSEEGKLRHFETPDGKMYGFTYRGKMYLDPTKIDAELPIHEFAHPWCEAFRRLNPDGWKNIVGLMKVDADTWEFVKQMNPDLTDENDIAEEMIAKFSGKKGAERAQAEFERMNSKDPDYKGKWGNIWKNISKAIQDFWKQVGDFLHIKYESAEQVYDQVVKDFADKINPRKKVEQFLKERDDTYLQAVEMGDMDNAKAIFDEALRENIGNGITPFISAGGYRGKMQKLAHGVKTRDPKVIAEVADLIAPLIPKDAVLVPAPSHTGKATDMLDLAQAISERTGAPIADVLKGIERDSQYAAKKAGKPLSASELGISMQGELPEGKMPVVIDNVVDSGNTAEACIQALGKGIVASLADSTERYKHVASLKSAEPVVIGKDGQIVPLSKRFELGSKYLERAAERQAEEPMPVEEPETGMMAMEDAAEPVAVTDYDTMMQEAKRRSSLTPEMQQANETVKTYLSVKPKDSEDVQVRKRATKAVLKAMENAGVPYKVVSKQEERQMMKLFSLMNQEAIKEMARRPSYRAFDPAHGSRGEYIVYNMNDPFGIPAYFEKLSTARYGLRQLKNIAPEGDWAMLRIGLPGEEASTDVLKNAADMQAEIQTWHGSGAVFVRFDHRHMGEGAGSQAFGYGTYLSDSKDVATGYAKTELDWNVNSESMLQNYEQWLDENSSFEKYLASNDLEKRTRESIAYLQQKVEEAADEATKRYYLNEIKNFEAKLTEEAYNKDFRNISRSAASMRKRKQQAFEEMRNRSQNLYKVEIPDETQAYYIDYNGRMKDQKDIFETVDNELAAHGWNRKEIDIRTLFTKDGQEIYLTPWQSGADLYAELEHGLGGAREASAFLHNAGITGIKYPAGTIMGGGEGATNYVIFDENDAKITDHIQFMMGWHGSGAKFDAFDHRYMGSGEGNQSYGWGTYITEVEGIGRMYAEAMGDRHKPATYKGMSYSAIRHLSKDFYDTIGIENDSQRDILMSIVHSLNFGYGDPVAMIRVKRESLQELLERKQAVIEDAKEQLVEDKDILDEKRVTRIQNRIRINEKIVKETQEALDFVNSLDTKDFEGWGKAPGSFLYKVDIPEDTGDNYFDWTESVPEERADKILAELRNRLLTDKKYGWNTEAGINRLDRELEAMKKFFGATFYGRMSVLLGNSVAGADFGGKRLASQLLSEQGYVGIKYPAEYMTGGRTDGAKNYVIFNEDNAKITDTIQFMMSGDAEAQKEGKSLLGWSDGKQVCLTQAGLNPNTPLHETTHMWDKWCEKENPELWKKLVNALKKTTMWEDISKNPNYRNIWNDENRMASEVHARLSGAAGEDEFMKAAFKKNTPQSIINEVKSALRKFWEAVLRLFNKHARTIADDFESLGAIVRMPIRDLVNKDFEKVMAVAEAEKNGQVEGQNGDIAARTMMGVHNISEEKLRKVIKQGGLANPSLAVIDTKGGYVHTDYGGISLIPKASLIDARTGRNAGTFTADAWTPTYPPVELVMKSKGWDKFFKDMRDIKKNADGGEELAGRVRVYLESYLENRDPDAMYWWYLYDRGLEPKTVRRTNPYDQKLSDRIVELTGGDERTGIEDLNDEAIKEIVQLYHAYQQSKGEEVKPAEQRIEYIKNRLDPNDQNKMRQLRLQSYIDELEKYGENRSNLNNFISGINLSVRRAGEVDDYSTFSEARKRVKDEGRKNDFDKWIEELNERYGIEEKIFDGYTPSGNRKYIPNTLENVSKYMKKQGLNGAMDWSSIGNWIAKVANKEKTLEGIRSQRKNLQTTEEEHDAFHEKWGTIMQEIAVKLGQGDNWIGEQRMTEALDHKDLASYVKREYGVELSKDDQSAIDTFIKEVRHNFPTGYFETKFERPVMLNEFEIAVVPEETSSDIIEALKGAGLSVYTYNNKGTLDEQTESRRLAVMEAVGMRNDIMFHIEDEPETLEMLDSEPTMKVYRSVQIGPEGKPYPPMSGKVDGEWRSPIEIGQWERSDEAPWLADENGRFLLDKGNGKKLKAAYNPYIHTSTFPLNDQFSEAQSRPELAVMEVEIPVSELTSGYKADKAKDTVGEKDWKAGAVQGQLTGQRKVILSRWDKPIRILSDDEVASLVAPKLQEAGVVMPTNVVTPALRKALEDYGVQFVSTDNKGKLIEGEHKGKTWAQWWKLQHPTGKKQDSVRRMRANGSSDVAKGRFLYDGEPIAQVTGNEFKEETDPKKAVQEYFAKEWNGAITREGLGEVLLDNRAVKDDFSHGVNREKIASFVAVPHIIKDGVIIDEQENWKDRNYDSLTIAAPISIGNEKYMGIAIIKRRPTTNRFYLHTVLAEKYLQDEMLRTGSEAANRQGGDNLQDEALKTDPKVERHQGDFAKILINLYNAKENAKKLQKGGENHQKMVDEVTRSAENLGGVKVNFVSSDDVTDEDMKNELHMGTKGIYDPNTGEVSILVDNIDSIDEAKRVVFHEKLGHEGLTALLGSNKAVMDFGNFLYRNADKALRRKMVDRADDEGYRMDDRDRWSKAAQEVFSDIAANGPATSEEFSLWTKAKHYLIRLLKALNVRIPGLLNDHDLRYYVLKTGRALKKWNGIDQTTRDNLSTPETHFDRMRAVGGKPRKRNNESQAQYFQRLREWERRKIAEEQDPEPKMPDLSNEEISSEYGEYQKDWMRRHGLPEDYEDMGMPRREAGESDADYMQRIRLHEAYEREQQSGDPLQPVFGWEPQAIKDWKRAYAEWKQRNDIREEENVDLDLYEGNGIEPGDPVTESEVDARMLRDLGDASGADTTPEGAKKHVKMAIIERRKDLESSNAEDAIFLHQLGKMIEREAKSQGVTAEELNRQLPHIIEETYFEEILRDENGNVVAINDISDQLPIKRTPGLENLLDTIKDWYDTFFHVLEDAGLRGKAGYIEDGYVNHVWDKGKSDPKAWEKYVEQYQRLKSPNMKHREVESYRMGIELGLKPKFEKLTDMMAYYSKSNNEAIANKGLMQHLSCLNIQEVNSDGEVTLNTPLLYSSQPDGLVRDRYSTFYVPGIGDIWVYKEAASKFANVFGPVTTPGEKAVSQKFWNAYDLIGSTAKKIQLSWSFFHAGALTEVYLAQGMAGEGPGRAIKQLMRSLVYDCIRTGELPAMANPDDFKAAASHLVKLGATDDYAAADVLRLTDKFRQFAKDMDKRMGTDKIGGTGPLGVVGFAMDAINKGMDTFLWSYLHDGLKIAMFKMFADDLKLKAEKKGWDDEKLDQMLDEAGQYVNDCFGGQFWELIDVSPKLLKRLQRVFLSPDWLLSTQRHFFANFGFGSLYNDGGFWEYVKYNTDNLKRAFGADIPKNDFRAFRSRNAKMCYIIGVLFGAMMLSNLANAMFRKWDEDKERSKAESDPSYKSKYDLIAPDGMKWYDYLMMGNANGQTTHMFTGRYEDGTETYIRWGKQFREFPELWTNEKGELEVPGPLVKRMMGKANPNIGIILDDITYLDPYKATHQDEELQRKYGKPLGLVVKTAYKFLPFIVPTQEGKEWKAVDLVFPSSKGFSKWKAQDYFKHYILTDDQQGMDLTYRSCVLNGIDPQQQLDAALRSVKAAERKELADGVKDLQGAWDKFNEAKSHDEKLYWQRKLKKYLAETNYDQLNSYEFGEKAKEILGTDDEDKKPMSYEQMKNGEGIYLWLSESEDVRDDYKVSVLYKKAGEVTKQLRSMEEDGTDTSDFEDRNQYWIDLRERINEYRRDIKELKSELGNDNDEHVMRQIRDARRELLEEAEELRK